MREFKIVCLNDKGELVNTYEMFSDYEAAERWADAENDKTPGKPTVLDIEFQDVNEELKYEY